MSWTVALPTPDGHFVLEVSGRPIGVPFGQRIVVFFATLLVQQHGLLRLSGIRRHNVHPTQQTGIEAATVQLGKKRSSMNSRNLLYFVPLCDHLF